MSANREKKVMGQSAPNEPWLAQVTEEPLEPALEIVDPHHHLWIRAGHRYLMPELAEDLASGHKIVATVYAEYHSMYRQDGPDLERFQAPRRGCQRERKAVFVFRYR